MKRFRFLLPLALTLVLAACQPTKVTPQVVGAHPDISSDEAGLWMVMQKEETKLRESPVIVRSPELHAYVRGVLCKVAGDYCSDLRLYIVEQPYFNASVAPNGAVQVWTGLLLRTDNEAELAFVLGHELGHYVHRDSVRQLHSAEDLSGGAMIFAAATAPFGGGLLSALVAVTSMYDYSRDLERDADAYGFDAMRKAGYDPTQCAEIWRKLSAEVAHSDIEDVRKSEARGSIFKTHPLTSERIANLAKMADASQSSGETGADRYRKAVAPFVARWIKDDVHRGDYGESLFLVDQLTAHSQLPGVAYFSRGETLRLRRHDGDIALAQAAYRQATTYPDCPPEAWRELGETSLKQGQNADAKAAFGAYLARNPGADDRAMIEATMSRL